MIIIKTKSAPSVSQCTKHATPPKTQNNTWKIDKYYTICGMTNCNVETCKNE
jgi:hypothetical protein